MAKRVAVGFEESQVDAAEGELQRAAPRIVGEVGLAGSEDDAEGLSLRLRGAHRGGNLVGLPVGGEPEELLDGPCHAIVTESGTVVGERRNDALSRARPLPREPGLDPPEASLLRGPPLIVEPDHAAACGLLRVVVDRWLSI